MDTFIDTDAGTLRGRADDGVRRFLGVHYGASTGGRARFAPPRPVDPWDGVRDALEFGPSAWQFAMPDADRMLEMWGGCAEPGMSEDCLVLNVWAPEEANDPLPVMIYLHGGGHAMGSGSWPAYDGNRLAARGDVVVVTLNHRLNVFGYLYLAELAGPRFASSGINGILDIVAALQWVRDNIALVGGDPRRIMVFGQSGGGAKTAALLGVPSSYGLYQAAAVMSSGSNDLREPADASETAGKLLHNLEVSVDDVEQLLSLPAERILDASLAIGDPLSTFVPVLDGSLAAWQPVDALAARRAPDVPLLIGTTRDEMATLLPPADALPADADDRWVVQQTESMLPDAERFIPAVRRLMPDASVWELYVATGTWAYMRSGSIALADARAAAGGAPVWMYRFDWPTQVAPFGGLAPHGVDVPFYFDTLDCATVSRDGAGATQLAEQLSSALVALAANGSPEHPGLPPWRTYDAEDRSTMLFDIDSRVVEDPDRAVRVAAEPPTEASERLT